MYLNCHSYYSLRYGTLSIEELVKQAKQCNVETLTLTDINATTGVFPFIKECRKAGIKPNIGVEFRNKNQMCFIGIARNREGFKELNDFLTYHYETKQVFPVHSPLFQNCYVIYPFSSFPKVLRENEYIGVRISDLTRLHKYSEYRDKFVIHHPVTISGKVEFNLHRLLRAVDYNVVLTKLTSNDYCFPNEVFLPIDQLLNYYANHVYVVNNTQRILHDCSFDFEFNKYRNKHHYTESKQGDKELLRRLVEENFEYRYGKNNIEAWNRVNKELEIIDTLGFGGYFLCTWDIVNYSLKKGLFHIGRGSGANSIVAYILKITNVCPIRLNLYFERFLNPSRKTPPDFDIDWSWKDRDTILDYVFERFGKDYVSFCGTITTFKHRSVFRELGKVMGLPKEEIDKLSGTVKDLHDNNSIVKTIHYYGNMLSRFPNQRSMHSCGVFISEKPLTYYTAMFMPPKGYRTAQIDMYIAEDIGFEKFDILSQRGLGTIESTIKLIKEQKGIDIDFNDTRLYLDNSMCNDMLSKGQTIGCFYVESPAMRGLLRRLKANDYLTLVAASSVIRPGVAKSGMLREFQYRHNNPNDFEYIHPVFEQHLGETYGVMVYQEDVIKIAHYFGGLSMADGDILRRGMSGKTRSVEELKQVKDRFFEGCRKHGHPEELAKEVYRQIESFAGYSFCKSHSASYAVESYLALYLKAFFPLEFMVSAINNFGGFYRSEVYFHEAKMSDAVIEQPCINNSEVLSRLKGQIIYVGFTHIEGFHTGLAKLICDTRNEYGPYSSLEQFIKRVPIGIEHLQLLIYVGAFRFTGEDKNELILKANMLMNKDKVMRTKAELFDIPVKKFKLPELVRNPFEDSFDEIEILNFSVTHTPFELLRTSYRGNVLVRDFLKFENKVIRIVGYLVSIKHVPTAKGNMNFGTWIDVMGRFFDSTHFPDVLKRYPFKGAGCYLMEGKIVVEFDFPTIEVKKLGKLPMINDPRYEDAQAHTRLKNFKDNNPAPLTRKPYPSKQDVAKVFGKVVK